MSEKYYKEELERISGLMASKRDVILGASLEFQGLELLKKDFEKKLRKLKRSAKK
ncbi:hypothetical protein HCJ39_13255 [Listeria rocourtiae]|uniref:hypothetical protein n=1 Tax=Listeria rocourtiae TaxID=647910 RepID=UPI00162771AE|nr:hypothetical protein [Listeria rocourtiae]MBC1605682.1 hypothetical protein [Listeria rocourtiae]